jgi:hypothetical protein
MRPLILPIVLLSSCIAIAAGATAEQATQRMAVTSIKPLLLAALDNGEAHGVLTGQAREVMRKVFTTDAPINIDVKKVGGHKQAGCARLGVTTRQRAVVLPPKKSTKPPAPEDMTMRYQIDYCRNGAFPAGEQ